MSTSLQDLLGLPPSSSRLNKYISALSTGLAQSPADAPEVKPYPDVVYFNYYALGISLSFKPINGYKPTIALKRDALQDDDLVLDGIDVYNSPKPASSSRSKSTYSTFAALPVVLRLAPSPSSEEGKPRPEFVSIGAEMTGKELVTVLGEPKRKGGGAGPSSGSIGIWCEWSGDGVMIEFGGDESRGPQAWERGKDAVWKVISIFPGSTD